MKQRLFLEIRVEVPPDTNQAMLYDLGDEFQSSFPVDMEHAGFTVHDVTYEVVMRVEKD